MRRHNQAQSLSLVWDCPAAFPSSLGLGTFISLSVLSRKKSQHNINRTVSWLWVRRCPSYLPSWTERKHFRKFSKWKPKGNRRKLEFFMIYSSRILMFHRKHTFLCYKSQKKEGLEGVNSLHSLHIKSLLQMSLKIVNIMREFYWVLREVVQFNWGFPVLSGAENKGLYCGLPVVFPFPRA